MVRRRHLDLWLPSYVQSLPMRLRGRLGRKRQLTHILVLVCDHFEPRHGISNEQQPFARLAEWHKGYAELQRRCRTEFGHAPVHSWFFPPHHGVEHLASLSNMVYDGLGEVELHYHHDGDTAETLTRDLRSVLQEYHRWGFLLSSGPEPRPAFGFIHGDWALNNSCNGTYCGVNNETDILASIGCWGDMTMPSANACQTRKINSIYYADGDTRLPKSHDTGSDAAVGRTEQSGFFMLQGPLAINWRAPGYPRIENASLTSDNWGRPDRIRKWLDCNIHVRGRPDWLFVKLHTHGAIERDFDALFGDKAMLMHRELNTAYNDGKRFKLHYVTARQAFNIAKAAEHGKSGDPSNWVDFMLPPQPHHYYTLDAQHDLRCCEPVRLKLASIAGKSDTQLNSRIGGLESLQGIFHAVEASDSVVEIKPVAGHKLMATFRSGYTIERIEGGSVEGGTFPNQRIITGFSESIRLSMNVEGQEAA